jgi:biotin carboxyl carrier protein
VKQGDIVAEGDQLIVMSAMKMETAIPAPRAGVVARVLVNVGDKVEGSDLLAAIEDVVVASPVQPPPTLDITA